MAFVRRPATPRPTIAGLSLKGFKSHRDHVHLKLGALTVLAGANSSGKSSAMQAMLLIKQTIESSFDPGALLLEGPILAFSAPDQLLWHAPGESAATFEVGFHFTGDRSLTLQFKQHGHRFVAERNLYEAGGKTAELRQGMTRDELKKLGQMFMPSSWSRLPPGAADTIQLEVAQERCFLVISPRFAPGEESLGILPSLLSNTLAAAIHVPGLRGNPSRSYKVTGTGPKFPGLFHEYVASVVASLDARAQAHLATALRQMGLTWKVEAREVGATQLELRVGRMPAPVRGGARDLVSIADVGFGVSQSLPVIVALVAAHEGQLVYIEQPEIHLHPRAQVLLADVVASAAQRGVRLVIETHSELLLRALQTLVARGQIAGSDAILHWFQRGEDGATQVRSAEMDKSGAFGDWPVDFSDVSMQADREYTDAAFKTLDEE